MAKTRSDLIYRALSVLGVLEAGQEPSNEDRDLVDASIYGKLDDLATREVVYLNDPDMIPEGWFEYLAILVANGVAYDFDKVPHADAIALAENRLRVLTSAQWVRHPMQSDYF